MSRNSVFDRTVKPTLFNPSFVAATNVINNYAYPRSSDSYQGQSNLFCERQSGQLEQRLKTVDVGDIILRREVSSRAIDVVTKANEKGRVLKFTNPFRARVIRQRQARFVKVRKTAHVAEIMQFGDRLFTVVQFKADNPNDKEQLQLANIAYFDLDDQFLANLSLQPSGRAEHWVFNLRTGTFHFDLTSNNHLLGTDDHHIPYYSEPWAPNRNAPTNTSLDPDSIIRYLQKCLPDYLFSVSSSGETRYIENLSQFITLHPRLAFGSVININEPGVLGQLLPSPVAPLSTEWCHALQDGVYLDWFQF
ncbi:hypothetical protein PM082_018247 [Marasmius tenuissimus]|nr:hypothetical protein PM082_018247 [Marasmius tenuissimus]